MDRRQFIKFLGLSSLAVVGSSCLQLNDSETLSGSSLGFFDEVTASSADEFIIPQGFSYDILRSWQDPIGEQLIDGKLTKTAFGYNNDFTCYFPLKGGKPINSWQDMQSNQEPLSEDGLLWVNLETVDPKAVPSKTEQRKEVGGAIFRIQKENSKWSFVEDDYNRRLDANTPFEVTGPAREIYPEVRGILANCSGGQTPWMTVLSGEENFHYFDSKNGWQNFNREHYGWIIEVDPYDKNSIPRKHTALGRFAHENAATAIAKSQRLVVYMGDDKEDEHIYKFVSKGFYNPNDRKANMSLLTEGDLYVAKLDKRPSLPNLAGTNPGNSGSGEWQLLSREANKKLRAKFKSQAELLINTRDAAKILGATPMDRAEDLEVNPYDGSIFVALSKNSKRQNHYGSILRIIEDANDHESLTFRFNHFLMGSKRSKVLCPDNFAFDNRGNLWLTTDIPSLALNKDIYKFHGNNSLFVVPLKGKDAGIAKRFAAAPRGAEFTGPWFSPDFKTLFLSVQHPGEFGINSTWPHIDSTPRSSVVAINLQ